MKNSTHNLATHTRQRRLLAHPTALIFTLTGIGLGLLFWIVLSSASAQSLANVTLNWVSPGTSATVNTPVPFEVGATGLADGTFTHAWTIDGTTTLTDTATAADGAATFTQTYTFGELGRFIIASKLTDGTKILTTTFRQVLVTGTLDITRTAVSTAEPTTFVVTMPELRAAGASEGAVYNLVIEYGDAIDSFERLRILTGTTTMTTTHQYLIGGTFEVTARIELIDIYNDYDADVLATGSVQTVVTQQIYMPIIGTDPEPPAPPVIPECEDINNSTAQAPKYIPRTELIGTEGWRCRGTLADRDVGRSNYYSTQLNSGDILVFSISELAADADYDLYLYDNNTPGNTTSVARSVTREQGTTESVSYLYEDTINDRLHYIRVLQYTRSASQHSYLLTIKISPATP
ncbi:hypothetical protein [Candidatus Chloroploca asiatica]|uniref:Uncharacterized protein n=1 Tax=Candidatus Chloroploca asiatica TaxID=1506545 RepID=A0A2H3KJJ8_9CHLR|nr:hypothetical protein [Candidatus Chloroploca asiatica]PDV98104.1 hypothetical protein A9Q02_03215 [Candidatus Chloroploca asiatica]